MTNSITITTTINAPIEKIWTAWNEPEHITKWAFASDDWEVPAATNDLTVGGTFVTTMVAKDKSASFDFTGTYTEVIPNEKIAYTIPDGRMVEITFQKTGENEYCITEEFQMENIHPEERQREGWTAILENFKKYVANN